MVSPEASLFTREILENALENSPAAPASWRPTAHALLANVLMNDVMNWWNSAGQGEIATHKLYVNEAINADPPNPVKALAQHAQGLIHRARRNYPDARSAFGQAVNSNAGFARAQAQLANQQVLSGGDRNRRGH